MNLLEHWIKEIRKEEEIKIGKNNYIKAEMLIDCYGQESVTEHLFTVEEYEKAKKDGYYLA